MTVIVSLHQVIGNGKKPFYDRRPQSRIRINNAAHAGFCGACGPCSCSHTAVSTPALSAVTAKPSRLRVDCWWNKSSVPDKYRRRPGGLEKVKEVLETEEHK